MEFPMARPKIVRTAEEAAAVDPSLPIQVEITLSPTEKMHQALQELALAKKATARALEKELELAEAELSRTTKRVEQLRQLTYGGQTTL
jgi:hypothetical protein